MKTFLLVLFVVSLAVFNAYTTPVINQDLVDEINASDAPWIAALNDRFAGVSVEEAKKLMGTILRKNNLPRKTYEDASVPDTFDARTQWPNCIHPIRNQEQCGSCWAFAATEALSDRLCIASNGKINVVLSPEDLVSCDTTDMGCNGGYLDHAWAYMQKSGVVLDSCFPYSAGNGQAAPCPSGQTCPGTGTWTKYHAKSNYAVNGVSNIMQEIYNNGPVEAGFSVYQDFMSYTGGVYTHKSGSLLGGHAIKILGWGTENNVDYWLVANSWGPSWGLQGFFKIKKGSNECGIESNVVAGAADVSSDSKHIGDIQIFHDSAPVLNNDLIEEVNTKQSQWKAGRNARFEGVKVGEARKLMGTRLDRPNGKFPRITARAASIPDSFDSRTQWPNCIHPIRNQEQCGSCWAFGASEALSDRICIATNGQTNVILSPEDLVSCDTTDMGCNGGYLENAWDYMQNTGIVTDSCFPYSAGNGDAAPCPSPFTCQDGSTPTRYKAQNIVSLSDVASIQTSIQTYGPVETGFSVYQDFMNYQSGVYKHTSGSLLGGHAVKIIGWGVTSDSTQYWIVANSWGTSWGINGFFWILRGVDECGIESGVVVGQAASN